MTETKFDEAYWDSRWKAGQTGWDIGAASKPLAEYFDQLHQKDLKILIPGAGNAWEAEYLHKQGFTYVYVIDLAPAAIQSFLDRVPDFPKSHALLGDFFELGDSFDLIIEQTFFCAIDPALRTEYVSKASELLRTNGKLVGLLFEEDFGRDHPPFGGKREDYLSIFEQHFHVHTFETAHNSIEPRQGREIFMNLSKR